MINQNAVVASRKKFEDEAPLGHGHTYDSSRNNAESRTHGSHMPNGAADGPTSSHRKDEKISHKEPVRVSVHLIISQLSTHSPIKFPIFMRLELFNGLSKPDA